MSGRKESYSERNELLEWLVARMLEHMEHAYYPRGYDDDGPFLLDPFQLMREARSALREEDQK